MATAQTPTRVGARGARRSAAQMILEALPDTSTAAVSDDLLSQFMRQMPEQQQQQQRRPQQEQQSTGPNASTVMGNALRSLQRQGPQGSAALQALLTYGPQSDRARRVGDDGELFGADGKPGQGPSPNMATVGTGPTPGWANTAMRLGGPMVVGSMLGPLGASLMSSMIRNEDGAGTVAGLGTRALTSLLPGPVNAALGLLSRVTDANPVRDMVKNPVAAILRDVANTPTPPVAPIQDAIADALAPATPPADADDGWEYDPVSDTWNNQSRNPGSRGGSGANAGSGGTNTGSTGAVSTGVSSGNATGYGLGPAGSGGYSSGSSGSGTHGGQMSGSGDGGGTRSSGY